MERQRNFLISYVDRGGGVSFFYAWQSLRAVFSLLRP